MLIVPLGSCLVPRISPLGPKAVAPATMSEAAAVAPDVSKNTAVPDAFGMLIVSTPALKGLQRIGSGLIAIFIVYGLLYWVG